MGGVIGVEWVESISFNGYVGGVINVEWVESKADIFKECVGGVVE